MAYNDKKGVCFLKRSLWMMPFLLIAALLFFGCSNQVAAQSAASSSGGYIIEKDGFFYFANPADDNRLSRMDDHFDSVIRLSEHMNETPFIELCERDGCLYYLQSEASKEADAVHVKHLCRYSLLTGTEDVLFSADIVGYAVADEWVYCSTVNPVQMYRIRLTTSESETIGKEYSNAYVMHNLAVRGNNLIYASHESITAKDLTTGASESIPGYSYAMAVSGYMLYSINYNRNYALERYSLNRLSSDKGTTLIEQDAVSFAVQGDKLIYSTSSGDICAMTKTGKQRLATGTCPILTQSYLFYLDADGNIGSMEIKSIP